MKTNEKAQVMVVNGRYRYRGDFHEIVPGTPIFDEKGGLCGVTNPRTMTYVHSLGGEAPFFEGLAKGQFLGTVCVNPECEGHGTRYLPFRICCPDCLGKMAVFDFKGEAQNGATIHTFIVTARTGAFNTLATPIRFIDVAIPGVATIIKSYMSGPGTPEIGMRLVPIFRTKSPTFTILDLSWVKEGTTEAELPEGFTFALPR